MVSNKDINWIYAKIQNRHRNALGVEKTILGEVLGLFETAPEFVAVLHLRDDISDAQLTNLLKEASRDAVILPGGLCEPSIELVETEKWIPVTERLPEGEGLYLVAVKNDHERRYSKTAWYHGHGNWFLHQTVTHWMPLPEPPKEV